MTDTETTQTAGTNGATSSALLSSPGFVAISILAVMTVIEYFLSVERVPALGALLALFAFGKAAVIVVSFMHIRNIFSEDHS